MEWTFTIKQKVAGYELTASAGVVGKDILLLLQGGDMPHLGCVVQAIPRESLSGDGSMSATSSVLNLIGHKDEYLCRKLAEIVAARKKTVVICTGGFHVQDIRQAIIGQLVDAVEKIAAEIVERLV